jgi:hypothetical protein
MDIIRCKDKNELGKQAAERGILLILFSPPVLANLILRNI